MTDYRVYTVGDDGHFIGFEPLVCRDDDEAVTKAERLVDGHDIELWWPASRDPDQSQAEVSVIQYKGIEFQVVQTANPTGFKWTVRFDDKRTRTGDSYSRLEAIRDAQRCIDKVKAKPERQ